jgi:hypothetical protein
MNGKQSNFTRAGRSLCVLGIAVLVAGRTARADEPRQPTIRPALQQLNDETTSLYEQVQAGLVRVEIPRPATNRFAPQIPPRPLQPQQQNQIPTTQSSGSNPTGDAGQAGGGQLPHIDVVAPAGANITVTARSPNGDTVTVVRSKMEMMPQPNQSPPADAAGNAVLGARMRAAIPAPSTIAILLDGRGHVLVPTFIDRPADGDPPLRVAGSDGSMQVARFVGSDRQTNLTVLQIDKPVGTPMQWTGDRPAKGSLVLYISPGDGSGRLGMWSGGAGEFGVVVSIDGHIDGIGQFLNGSACQLIAQQLVQFGSVKRATLGIFISEILPDDPLRTQLPSLGSRSAMKVENVIAGSAADKAGLKIGDLVLELAGQPVNDIPSFAAAIAARSGHTDVQILRGEKVLTISADLEPK